MYVHDGKYLLATPRSQVPHWATNAFNLGAANNETHEFYNSSKCVANLLKVCDPKAVTTTSSIPALFPARAFLPRLKCTRGADGKI
jgi:hypothetical protein